MRNSGFASVNRRRFGWLIEWLRDHNAPVEQVGVELGAPILVVHMSSEPR